jgi:hypothetical protein
LPVAVTKEQALIWVEEIRRGLANVRYYLLKIRDTKAYVALGYETFEAFGAAEFGYEKSHLYRLADAAEIELSLNSPLGEKPIPERHLRPLASVPEEERQAIWDEATRIAEESGKKLTAKMVEEAVADWRQQFLDERNEKREQE